MRPGSARAEEAEAAVVGAIDIGGTKVAAAVVGPDGIRSRQQMPTRGTDGEELFDRVSALLEAAIADAGGASTGVDAVRAIGVGCGGPTRMADPRRVGPAAGADWVSPLNIPGWRDFPLRARLADRFGLPVRVDNDAKAFALGEGRHGAARGVADYVAMVVSTGVGGGIVLGGRLVDGADGNAGHIGHVIVTPDGEPCPCGARGCLEAEVSGTALARITGRPAAEAPEELRRHTGRLVGRAVASVCNLLDLRLAVVAGSVALGFGDPFFSEAQAELDRLARLDYSRGARVVPSGCGPDGPLLGAAAVGRLALARPT